MLIKKDCHINSLGCEKETVRSAIVVGAKQAVKNYKKIDTRKRADLWIGPRPQSDGR